MQIEVALVICVQMVQLILIGFLWVRTERAVSTAEMHQLSADIAAVKATLTAQNGQIQNVMEGLSTVQLYLIGERKK